MTTTITKRGAGAPAAHPWWTPGDWNAFFVLGTNILVSVLVLTGLLRFVLEPPDHIIFGHILPAIGQMLFLSTTCHAWLARKLATETDRGDARAQLIAPRWREALVLRAAAHLERAGLIRGAMLENG